MLDDVFTLLDRGLAAQPDVARLERDIDSAWEELSVTNGSTATSRSSSATSALPHRRPGVRERDRRRRPRDGPLGRRGRRRAAARDGQIAPFWNLAKKVLHYDPLRGAAVRRTTVEILADFLRLIGQEQRLAQMQERGTLQKTADWLDTQLASS